MIEKELTNLSESFYKQLLDSIDEGVYFVDRSRRISFWNSAAERISGYPAEMVHEQFCGDGILMHVDFDGNLLCGDSCPLKATLATGQTQYVDVFLKHREGHRIPVRVIASAVFNENNEIIGAVERFHDITPQLADRTRLDKLAEEANTDALTGIPNRRFLEMEINERFFRFETFQECFGVMFVDMDDLKGINDKFGHGMGDRAIQIVAKTLQGSFRREDLVGRWGGDEFIVVVGNVDLEVLENIKQKVKTVVGGTVLPDVEEVEAISISIGVAEVLEDDTFEKLIKRADMRMYEDKGRKS
jgi:diguanylate cyclase (GGDEF)-like protein/PAS domain S-box-containing protein